MKALPVRCSWSVLALLVWASSLAAAPELKLTLPLQTDLYSANIAFVTGGHGKSFYVLLNGFDLVGGGYKNELVKISDEGQILWRSFVGSSDSFPSDMVSDASGNVYISGDAVGAGVDGFISSVAPGGQSTKVGVPLESPRVAAGGGHVYAAGRFTTPDLSIPDLVRVISLGDMKTVDYASGAERFPNGAVGVDGNGNVYLGFLEIPDFLNAAPGENFFRAVKFSPGLQNVLWDTRQPGAMMGCSPECPASWAGAVGRGDPRGGIVFLNAEADPSSFVFSPALRRVNASGAFSAPMGLSANGGDLMAVDAAGNAYVLQYVYPNVTVARFNPAGGNDWTLGSGSMGGLIPTAIGVSQDHLTYYMGGSRASDGALAVSVLSDQPVWHVEPIPLSSTETVGNVGETLAARLSLKVMDGQGNPNIGAQILFSVTAPTATTQGHQITASKITNQDGLAQAIFTFGDTPAEYKITATCPDCEAARSTATFTCCGGLKSENFKQFDVAWATTTYGSTQVTIKGRGCALTSLAMLNNHYWKILPGPELSSTTPNELNKYLIALGTNGYTSSGGVVWTGIERFSKNKIRGVGEIVFRSSSYTLDEMRGFINDDLEEKRPVIICIQKPRSTHFMLVVGKCGKKYVVSDPGTINSPAYYDPDASTNPLISVVRFRRIPTGGNP